MYNYLFYKGYQLAKMSKNWENSPLLFAIMIISWCVILNLGTLLFFVEGLHSRSLDFGGFISFLNSYRYIFGLMVVILVYFYYYGNNRWRRILDNYEAIEKDKKSRIHPLVVVLFFYVFSFLLGLVAAMFKNGDGIFR